MTETLSKHDIMVLMAGNEVVKQITVIWHTNQEESESVHIDVPLVLDTEAREWLIGRETRDARPMPPLPEATRVNKGL